MPCGDALQAFRPTLQVGETGALVHPTRKRSRPKTLVGQSLREDRKISKKLERSRQELARLICSMNSNTLWSFWYQISSCVRRFRTGHLLNRWAGGHLGTTGTLSKNHQAAGLTILLNWTLWLANLVQFHLLLVFIFVLYLCISFFEAVKPSVIHFDWNTSWHIMTYQCIKTKTWFVVCIVLSFFYLISSLLLQKWSPGLSDYVRLRSCKSRGLIPHSSTFLLSCDFGFWRAKPSNIFPGSSELPQRC